MSAACRANYPTEPTPAQPIALMIHSGALPPIEVRTNAPTFLAYALDADGAWREATTSATWTSSNPDVARLIERSRFMPVSPGTITITARYEGLEATANMVVIDNSQDIADPYPQLMLFPNIRAQVGFGGTVSALFQTSANSSRQQVASEATWTSEDPRVATVDDTGRVRAIAVGRTVIRASFGGATRWFYLTIAPL
jgi:hypothetical protein